MTVRPLFTPAARDDLREIGDYIGQDSPGRALTFVRELREHCRRLAAQPRLHRLREEFGPGVRGTVCMASTSSSTRTATTARWSSNAWCMARVTSTGCWTSENRAEQSAPSSNEPSASSFLN